MTKNTTFKFNVGDIVTIAKFYRDSVNLDIALPQIHVYSVRTVNADGTITLAGVINDIPAKYIGGVPLRSELAKQIYFDTNYARPYVPGKVYLHEVVYSRSPFMVTMEERFSNTPMWKKMQVEEFHYIHELQHWLIEYMGCSKIRINEFFSMQKPRKI